MAIAALHENLTLPRAFFALLGSEKPRLIICVIGAIIGVLLETAPWLILWQAIYAAQAGDSGQLLPLAAGLLLALIARYALYNLAGWQAHIAAYRIIEHLREHLVDALSTLPLAKLNRFHRGDLEKRVLRESERLEPVIAHYLVDIIAGLLLPLVLLNVLFWVDWRLALVALIPLPLAVLLQKRIMAGYSDRQREFNQSVTRTDNAMLEFLNALPVMKAFRRDAESFQQLERALENQLSLVAKVTGRMIIGWTAFVTVSQSSLILVLPAAAFLWLHQQLALPEFALALMLSCGLLRPWLRLSQLHHALAEAFIALEQLIPLFGSPAHHAPSLAIDAAPVLQADEVSLHHANRPVLSPLSATFAAGKSYALVGPSGAGKSSLLNVLSGSIQADTGRVLLGGHCLMDFSENQRSTLLMMVTQNNLLLRMSLRQNLLLAARPVTDSLFEQVLALTGLQPIIAQLPHGLDTLIGDAARQFSGGERQRIAIARGLFAQTPILLLDEASSHLDSPSEQHLMQGIRQLFPQQTLIFVTHRLGQAQLADHIMVLEQGQICAQGHHFALMDSCPLYQTLNRHYQSEEQQKAEEQP
ncbi:ABC transporter ATP-binding protein [Yersinia kristensenii]|uniref:ABC transporter ATP-binding protein n=1 Tax=Yersinia kristensenii TaxID=28152 RepID=UPI0011A5FDF5|nr:ABC transporter ATP-binding protein [Yersinia kristensenii]